MPQRRIANGLNVHYVRAGTGPDLVLIHGLVAHLGNWHFKIVPMLWDKFNVLTYDLRGHGYTELTETGYTPTELAEDLKLLLDDLDIEKVDVAGHSFGADVALYFAHKYPERVDRAVLIEPLLPAIVRILTRRDFRHAGFVARALNKLGVPIPKERRLDPEYMVKAFLEMPVKWGPMKDMPKQDSTKEWLIKLATNTSVLKDILDVGDLTLDEVPNIQTPIHLVYDSDSLMWHKSYTFLRDNLPNVTSIVLNTGASDLSHFLPLEQPEVIAEQILYALGSPELVRS